MIYNDSTDWKRVVDISSTGLANEPYRTHPRRDYARLIHSPSFRRLIGKTQLFPGRESDFFRNRLTHSLEVSQIAKSIAIRLNFLLTQRRRPYQIDLDLVEFAGLAHDLGHPPFGHLGEEALDTQMLDAGGFEGNAQTLRILTKIEKKQKQILLADNFSDIDDNGNDNRVGLNLCYRSLASILKYDYEIPMTRADRRIALQQKQIKKLSPVKGYYQSESEIVKDIKAKILAGRKIKTYEFKTIECSIMDLADDIAYSTYDLEDSFKGGFITPLDLLTVDRNLITNVRNKVNEKLKTKYNIEEIGNIIYNTFIYFFDLPIPEFSEENYSKENYQTFMSQFSFVISSYFYKTSKTIANNGYSRSGVSSRLIGEYMRKIDININEEIPELSRVTLPPETLLKIEILKRITFEYQINSNKLKLIESRGKEIVSELFKEVLKSDGKFLPEDQYIIYKHICANKIQVYKQRLKKRIVCDFIASMTDDYAIEFYGRLKSENPQTIFKPLF